MEIPLLPHPDQHSPRCSLHLLPGSSSSPRAWAGFCWHSLRRGPRGQKQHPGEAPPKPVRVRYLQLWPGRGSSALGHGRGAGPSTTPHLSEPLVCPSHILAPCQERGVIPAPPEVHTQEHFSHEHFKEQGPDGPFSQAAFAALRLCMTDPEFQFLQVSSTTSPLTLPRALPPGEKSLQWIMAVAVVG